MYIAIIILAAAADLAFLLPQALKAFFFPDLPYFWIALGQMIDAVAVTGCWLLGYLLWEKRFAREVRDGVSFWTAVGAALARVLVCAASAAALLRGESARTWTLEDMGRVAARAVEEHTGRSVTLLREESGRTYPPFNSLVDAGRMERELGFRAKRSLEDTVRSILAYETAQAGRE